MRAASDGQQVPHGGAPGFTVILPAGGKESARLVRRLHPSDVAAAPVGTPDPAVTAAEGLGGVRTPS